MDSSSRSGGILSTLPTQIVKNSRGDFRPDFKLLSLHRIQAKQFRFSLCDVPVNWRKMIAFHIALISVTLSWCMPVANRLRSLNAQKESYAKKGCAKYGTKKNKLTDHTMESNHLHFQSSVYPGGAGNRTQIETDLYSIPFQGCHNVTCYHYTTPPPNRRDHV